MCPVKAGIKRERLEQYKATRSETVKPAPVDQEIGAAKAVINLAFENDMVAGKTYKTFNVNSSYTE